MSAYTAIAKIVAKAPVFAGRLMFSREKKTVLAQWSASLMRDLGIQIYMEGNLPSVPDGCLWVANHLSWLDPVALFSLRPAVTIAKGEVKNYPLIGSIARAAGIHFVERSCPLSQACALMHFARALKAGENLVIFPEGTTTIGDSLAELHEGGLRAAYRLNVPVLPFSLFSDDYHYFWIDDDDLVSHLSLLLKRRGANLSVYPYRVLYPKDYSCESQWVEAIRMAIDPRLRFSSRCA